MCVPDRHAVLSAGPYQPRHNSQIERSAIVNFDQRGIQLRCTPAQLSEPWITRRSHEGAYCLVPQRRQKSRTVQNRLVDTATSAANHACVKNNG